MRILLLPNDQSIKYELNYLGINKWPINTD